MNLAKEKIFKDELSVGSKQKLPSGNCTCKKMGFKTTRIIIQDIRIYPMKQRVTKRANVSISANGLKVAACFSLRHMPP
jgi:hypothetical protein